MGLFESLYYMIETFSLSDLSPDEIDRFYDVYKTSYEKETGSSWTKDKFLNRASHWEFFGDIDGGIALRWQPRAKMYKMVATYGSPIKVARSLKSLRTELSDKPIWGAMSKKLADSLESSTSGEFKKAPPLLIKTLIPFIKQSFGDVIESIDKDGALNINISEIGTVKKYYIANKNYYKQILDNGLDSMSIPDIIKTPLKFLLKKLI